MENNIEYSQRTIDDLRFLTFPHSFKEGSFLEGRYDKYANNMENQKLTIDDVLLIKDFFTILDLDINNEENVEDFLLDLFAAKNNGSLTCNCSEHVSYRESKYNKLFCFKNKNKKLNIDELNNPIVIFEDENEKPVFAGFQKYIKAFILLKEKLNSFIEENRNNYNNIKTSDYKNILDNTIENLKGAKPCPEQRVAIANSMINKSFSVITGGPGTGKTTVVFSLIQALVNLENLKPEDICLMAPTGRAATRIKEQVEKQAEENGFEGAKLIDASTIHKFLQKIDLDPKRKPSKKYKLVVVDEMSMVDVYLMSSLLLKFDPTETKVILVGDVNQLPSVDTGCVLYDIVKDKEKLKDENIINMVKEITSDNIFETKQDNDLCPSVPCGFISDLRFNHRAKSIDLNKVFVEIEDEEKLSLKIIDKTKLSEAKGPNFIKMTSVNDNLNLIMDYLNHAYFDKDEELGDSYINYVKKLSESFVWSNGIDNEFFDKLFNHINKYRVLCPKRKGIYGSEKINRMFYNTYSNEVRENAKYPNGIGVMVIRNDYKINLSNGDIGIILRDKENTYKVVFKIKDEYVSYSLSNLESFENAFALSIHKSQGSEYKNVFIPIEPSDNDEFLTKELIYTAVTRAKESFVIFSEEKTLEYMRKNKIERINHLGLYD